MKVLIVDDEPDVRSLVRSALEYARVPMEAVEAADAEEALAAVASEKPDIMVLDLALPARDGFSVLEELRRTSDLPVIVLTARGLEHDKIRGLELGADDYMTKPFSPRELLARIETVLRRTTRTAGERGRGVIEAGELRDRLAGAGCSSAAKRCASRGPSSIFSRSSPRGAAKRYRTRPCSRRCGVRSTAERTIT